MKSTEELRQLFDNQLREKLFKLEAQRKKVRNDYLILGLLVVSGVLSFVIADSERGLMWLNGVGVGIVIFTIYYFIKSAKIRKAYVTEFKTNVVKEIVKLIDANWQYRPFEHISETAYRTSKLFTKSYDRYKGDDHVSGVINKTDFQISELHTEYKTETTDSKGRKKTEWHTIFKGLFAHMEFNKEIKGETFVLPDTAEKLFGSFGKKFQAMSSKGELVNLENPEFEKLFVVYGSDQIEARYILTPTMMEAMVRLAREYGQKVYFSFRGSRVYFAISIRRDLFEPRVFKSGVNYEDIEEMNRYFGIIQALIHEMNLNTRIWTKE